MFVISHNTIWYHQTSIIKKSQHCLLMVRYWEAPDHQQMQFCTVPYIDRCFICKTTVYPKKYAHGFCFAVLCCGYWLIFPYPSGLLHWLCGNLTIAPVPAKQPWWIGINTSCEFIMNDCITTTKQSTTKPCAYFLGYTVYSIANTLRCTSASSSGLNSARLLWTSDIATKMLINIDSDNGLAPSGIEPLLE